MSDDKKTNPFSWFSAVNKQRNSKVVSDENDIYKLRAERMAQVCKEVEEERTRRLSAFQNELNTITAKINTANENLNKVQALVDQQHAKQATFELVQEREKNLEARELTFLSDQKQFNVRYEALANQERILKEKEEKLADKERELKKQSNDLLTKQTLLEQLKQGMDVPGEDAVAEAESKQKELLKVLEFDLSVERKRRFEELEAEIAEEKAKIQAEQEKMCAHIAQEKTELDDAQKLLLQKKSQLDNERTAWEALRDQEQKALATERERYSDLQQRENELREREIVVEKQEEKLTLEQKKVEVALQEVQSEFKAKRNLFQTQLLEEKQKAVSENEDRRTEHLAKLNAELDERRRACMAEIEAQKARAEANLREADAKFEAEMAARQAEWEKKQSSLEKAWAKTCQEQGKALEEQRNALDREKGKIESQKRDLECRFGELEESQSILQEQKEQTIRRLRDREDNLDAEAAELAEDYKVTLDAQKARLVDEVERLRSELVTQEQLVDGFRDLQRRLGDRDPSEVIRDLNLMSDEIRRLREDLSTRPTEDIRARIDTLQKQGEEKDLLINKLNAELLAKERPAAETASLMREIAELKAAKESAEHTAQSYKETQAIIELELNKVRKDFEALFGSPADLEVRTGQVEKPYIEEVQPPARNYAPTEMEWLNGIYKACEDYGLHFNRRLLLIRWSAPEGGSNTGDHQCRT